MSMYGNVDDDLTVLQCEFRALQQGYSAQRFLFTCMLLATPSQS